VTLLLWYKMDAEEHSYVTQLCWIQIEWSWRFSVPYITITWKGGERHLGDTEQRQHKRRYVSIWNLFDFGPLRR
jgi:hypothetical protein